LSCLANEDLCIKKIRHPVGDRLQIKKIVYTLIISIRVL